MSSEQKANFHHIPVLLEEVMTSLNLKPDGIYIDGTLGGGGHSENILLRTQPTGRLIGIDQDDEALSFAKRRLERFAERAMIVKSNFSQIDEVMADLGINQIDGILLDIGVSSHQLDQADRGFSYMTDAPLDMRMDQNSELPTAADLLAHTDEEDLANIIYKYGEERFSRRIARQIVEARKVSKITTTFQLVELVTKAIPRYNQRREAQHPAKRTFQALRIAVNQELQVLEQALDKGLELLSSGGRFSVITFHSLEDRIVKDKFRQWATGCICPPDFPICQCGNTPKVKLLTRKPIISGAEELVSNPRARSAKLRYIEKL